VNYINQTANATRRRVSGRGLSVRVSRKSAVERALLAALIAERRVDLDDLSIKMIADMCRVCVPYVKAMQKLPDHERLRVVRGKRSLLEPNQLQQCAHPRGIAEPAQVIFDALKARIDQLTDTSVVQDETVVPDSIPTEEGKGKTA
jgi:hypothetical protein